VFSELSEAGYTGAALLDYRPAGLRTGERATVRRIVRAELGVDPVELRFVDTDDGLVAYLTLRLGANTLADAHADASRIEELIRRERPEITDVVVHTEPQ